MVRPSEARGNINDSMYSTKAWSVYRLPGVRYCPEKKNLRDRSVYGTMTEISSHLPLNDGWRPAISVQYCSFYDINIQVDSTLSSGKWSVVSAQCQDHPQGLLWISLTFAY